MEIFFAFDLCEKHFDIWCNQNIILHAFFFGGVSFADPENFSQAL
jgi:hypothetical protein